MSLNPAFRTIMVWFENDHLPPHLASVSILFQDLAAHIAEEYDGPEAMVAIRKLLEAKDCAVRAAIKKAKEQEIIE